MKPGTETASPSTPHANPGSAGGSTPAVTVSDLRFDYPGRTVLDLAELSIPAGCIYGFLGPNGSGKTTLFSILATLKQPSRGSVRVNGFDAAVHPAEVRRSLGVAFQHPAVDKQLSCLENLLHHGRLYGLPTRAIHSRSLEMLSQFDLADRRNERAGQLSGGLLRRLELAKALMHSPPVLLLDEPATGLDPAARFRLWGDLKRLQATSRVTIVLTTHLMEEADRCDRLAILHEGRVVREGPPEELKNSVGTEIIHIEASEISKLAQAIRDRFQITPRQSMGALRLERSDAHRLVPELMEAFAGNIRSVRVSRPSLEDVFLKATGSEFEEVSHDVETGSV
jgi:ABC-2 type transport system ATP-binding protein